MNEKHNEHKQNNVNTTAAAAPLVPTNKQQVTTATPSRAKHPWTLEEDATLMALVQKYGSKDWLSICSNLPSRNRKQCRDRFMNHLRQKVKKGSWTQEEDNLIFEWQKKVGNKWSVIAQYLPHRSDNAIKNRFWSALRSKQRRAIKEAKRKERQKRIENSRKIPIKRQNK